jgi:phospholipid transport system transporter-binding protein
VSSTGLARLNEYDWRLDGELCREQAPSLIREFLRLFNTQPKQVFDLSAVKRVDSVGVALLLNWVRYARRRKVEIKFRNPPRQLAVIAQVCGVRALLPLI